jgi:hypothetical protein
VPSGELVSAAGVLAADGKPTKAQVLAGAFVAGAVPKPAPVPPTATAAAAATAAATAATGAATAGSGSGGVAAPPAPGAAPALARQLSSGPRLACAATGCSFFGSARMGGLCSGCFRKLTPEAQGALAASGLPVAAAPAAAAAAAPPAAPALSRQPSTGARTACVAPGCTFFGSSRFSGYCSGCAKVLGVPVVAPPAPAPALAVAPTLARQASAGRGTAHPAAGAGGPAGPTLARQPSTGGAAAGPGSGPSLARQLSATRAAAAAAKGPRHRCSQPGCTVKLNPSERTMVCACVKAFCSRHRLPEQHACPVDFRARAKKALETDLVKVRGGV